MLSPIKILIIGNGFGGVYVLKNLHKFFHNDKRIELSLVGEKNYFLFTPLLHEVATGGINPFNIIEPILEPEEWYENEGYKSGVVYSCGNRHLGRRHKTNGSKIRSASIKLFGWTTVGK